MSNPNSPQTRLPIEPLMEAMGVTGASEFAAVCGIARRSFYRLKESGLTVWQADEYAVKFAGMHPFCVWGDAFYADLWGRVHDRPDNSELGEAA